VDALSGDMLWQAGPFSPTGGAPSADHEYLTVSGMNYVISSDVAVITDKLCSVDSRGYVDDTGGNIWCIDMPDIDVTNWTATKLASVLDTDPDGDGGAAGSLPEGLHKFMFPPDAIYGTEADGTEYDTVLVGTGDRATSLFLMRM